MSTDLATRTAQDSLGLGFSASASADQMKAALEWCKIVTSSGIVPKGYAGKPNDLFVAACFGARHGIDPLESANSIAVINGRPTMWGDMVLALVNRSSEFESIAERDPAECESKGEGRCEVKRKGREPIVRTFSVAQAQKAGLWTKDSPWKYYPGRMLQMRARSYALRDCFPDVLKGLRIRELETEDTRDVEVTVVEGPHRAEPLKPGDADRLLQGVGVSATPSASAPTRASASGTPPAAESNGSAKVRGILIQVGMKTGEKNGKPWKRHWVKLDNDWLGSTFSDTIGAELQALDKKQIEITYSVKGDFNTIESVSEVKAPSEHHDGSDGSVPASMFDDEAGTQG